MHTQLCMWRVVSTCVVACGGLLSFLEKNSKRLIKHERKESMKAWKHEMNRRGMIDWRTDLRDGGGMFLRFPGVFCLHSTFLPLPTCVHR